MHCSGKRRARERAREAKRARLAQSNDLQTLPVDEQEQLALFLLQEQTWGDKYIASIVLYWKPVELNWIIFRFFFSHQYIGFNGTSCSENATYTLYPIDLVCCIHNNQVLLKSNNDNKCFGISPYILLHEEFSQSVTSSLGGHSFIQPHGDISFSIHLLLAWCPSALSPLSSYRVFQA